MAVLEWDKVGERFYETGVDRGVLYLPDETGAYDTGVAWNGLVSVTDSPSGAEPTKQYADNIPYLTLVSAEEFGGTIEAFTYPVEFEACDGTAAPTTGVTIGQQTRSTFGFSYRSLIGNDLQGTDLGYKIHCVYGALAAPTEKAYSTVNDSPEAATFSWEYTTTPIAVTGFKPTSTLVIDSREIEEAKLEALEDLLYGTTEGSAQLPTPDEIIALVTGE